MKTQKMGNSENKFYLIISLLIAFQSAFSQQREFSSFEGISNINKSNKPGGPEWMHHASFYQVYPQTFYDTNKDGIGDLEGIIQKLDYIKSLGVDAIWLNPFYVSPFKDAGYDVADYYKVDPRYGTNKEAKQLFALAKQKGLKVILDFVPGHTSVEHPWFKAASKSEKNKFSNWYIWTDGTWFDGMEKYKENFIQGYSERDGNFMTNFFWHQPALNFGWGNPDPKQPWQLAVDHPDILALREEMKNILRFWLDMGCDGFRVDMAGSLVKNDPQQNIRFFWQDVRKFVDDNYPEAFLVSEWGHPQNAINAGFHADFMHWFDGFKDLFDNENSFFRSAGNGNISKFLNVYLDQYQKTQGKGYISLPVGNHDLIRIMNSERDQRDLEIIQVFAFTMPNIPFVYYGDEIGMRQLPILTGKEGCYGNRAGARTPMQWNNEKNCGFSKAKSEKLYLPVDQSQNAPNVMVQESKKNSLLNFTRQLIQLHKTEPALANYASFTPVFAVKNQYPFVYVRANNNEKVMIVLNPSDKTSTARIDGTLNGSTELILGSNPIISIMENQTTIVCEPKSYSILKVKN